MPSYPDGIFSFEWQDNATTPLSATNLNTTSAEITRIERALGLNLIPAWAGSPPPVPFSQRARVDLDGNLLLAEGAGNVGAGLTGSPGAKVHIGKDVTGSAPVILRLSATGSNNRGYLGLGYDYVAEQGDIQSSMNDGTPTGLRLNPNGGNVGVGTTNLVEKFEVSGGNVKVTNGVLKVVGNSDRQLDLDRTGVPIGNGYIWQTFREAGVERWWFRSNAGSGRFDIQNALSPSSVRLSLFPTGEVGVGTTAPIGTPDASTKMYVDGDVRLGNDRKLQLGGSPWNFLGQGQSGYPYLSMAAYWNGSNWVTTHSGIRGTLVRMLSNQILFSSGPANVNPATLTDHMVIKVDGGSTQIGMGTTTPRANTLLDVRGNVRLGLVADLDGGLPVEITGGLGIRRRGSSPTQLAFIRMDNSDSTSDAFIGNLGAGGTNSLLLHTLTVGDTQTALSGSFSATGNLTANGDGLLGGKFTYALPTSQPSGMGIGQVTAWLDESGGTHTLKFRVQVSSGIYKTGAVALS